MSAATTNVATDHERNRATALLIEAAQLLARGGMSTEHVNFLIEDLRQWINRTKERN